MTLDPEVRALLTAIRDLDDRTRDDVGEHERSMALAFVGGVMRAVLVHGVEPRHATPVIAAWVPTAGAAVAQ